MHEIISKKQLASNVTSLTVRAQRIAVVSRPGQFVIVRQGAGAERIPLTIADADARAGTITLVIQAIGKSTRDIVKLHPGDEIDAIVGPLGQPTKLISGGSVVCVGGGVGTAVVYPIAQGLGAIGVPVISIIGAQSKDWVIYEDELRRCGEVIVCTDDGSYGHEGFVTDALTEVINLTSVIAVYAAGPVSMMQAVAELTRPHQIKTIVSLNTIMIDGTGMCGGCRVNVGDKTKYACVDGPEFDGHLVDFVELRDRLSTYSSYEREAIVMDHSCRINR